MIKIKLFGKKKISTPSFFDFSSEERKKIIKRAAVESNKKQLDLIKRYNKALGI